jgi:hypothetical protein
VREGAGIGRSRLNLLVCIASHAILLLLAACATAPVRAPSTADLPEAEGEPLAFLSIAFPIDVPVKASVIMTKPVGITSEILACVEHENVVGFVPPSDVDFVNLYLVRQTRAVDPAVESRYLVVESWRYRPSAGVKICHQWVIWQDDPSVGPGRATYAVLVEDFENVVLDRRALDVEPDVLARLAVLYDHAVAFFSTHPPQPEQPPPVRDSVQHAGTDGSRGIAGSG